MTADQTPRELLPIATQLDELGQRDRDAAPTDLERRVLTSLHSNHSDHEQSPPPIRFPSAPRRWRLAAMLAVAAGAAIVGMASLWPVGLTPASSDPVLAEIESEIDDFLAITASWEELDEDLPESEDEQNSDFWGPEIDDDLLTEDSL
jgi:hypothetical protein